MAKGNMLLGYARGSVGDVTFYRDGGLQRARARNRRPGNPRSSRQMTQRALFANAVKFHKLAVSKFFKFAFEDKKANESDYNAFMRENLKRGVLISKTAFDTQDYPALGDWILSRGSLAEIFGVAVGDDVATQSMHFPLPCRDVTLLSNPTIGDISQALISQAQGQWMVGDIITLVEVTAGKYDVPTATPTPRRYLTNFLLWQFIVDPSDTRTFKSLVQDFYISNQTIDGVKRLCISVGVNAESAAEYWQQGLHQAGVIHSRVGDTTQVSRCELVANANYRQAIEDAQADSYVSAVLADWQASGEAILQGSLADPYQAFGIASTTYDYNNAPAATGATADSDFNVNAMLVTSANPYLAVLGFRFNCNTAAEAQRLAVAIPRAESDRSMVDLSNVNIDFFGTYSGNLDIGQCMISVDGVTVKLTCLPNGEYAGPFTGNATARLSLATTNGIIEAEAPVNFQ